MIRTKVYVILFTSLFFNFGFAQNAVTPGSISVSATYESIGAVWNISGDQDFDSQLIIEFRVAGSSSFNSGAITMRATPGAIIDGSPSGYNYHAGSVLFLEPDTDYELNLILSDPDGGSATETRMIRTKAELPLDLTGNLVYVAPGSSGGTGTQNDPYQGLQTALDQAQPGDVIQLAEGMYAAANLAASGTAQQPIILRGTFAGDSAIIDGANTLRGVLTLGENVVGGIEHIVIEDLILQNGTWGVDAQHSRHICFRHNVVRDVNFGYVNRRDLALESHQTISDNVFLGINSWPASGIPSERAVDLRGNLNVVRYNHIRNFGDGISTDGPPYQANFAMDIHNNDIAYIVDDAIEVDGAVANVRIWNNQCINARAGMSVAPIFGGPVYIVRNFLLNFEISAYKMNRGPAGLVIVHNTAGSSNRGMTSPSGYQNTYFRNNVLYADEYVFEEFDLNANSLFDDWNYNAYSSNRSGVNGAGQPWFKWDNVRYDLLPDLQASGRETNSISFAHLNELPSARFPSVYSLGVVPEDINFIPTSTSVFADVGEVLPNLNLPFVTDGQPDVGALEIGAPMPQLGPRDRDVSTGLSDVKLALSCIELYPNPTPGTFRIEGMMSAYTIQILNAMGQTVQDLSGQHAIEIDLSDLPTGLYFISIQETNQPIVSMQLILQD